MSEKNVKEVCERLQTIFAHEGINVEVEQLEGGIIQMVVKSTGGE